MGLVFACIRMRLRTEVFDGISENPEGRKSGSLPLFILAASRASDSIWRSASAEPCRWSALPVGENAIGIENIPLSRVPPSGKLLSLLNFQANGRGLRQGKDVPQRE